MKLKIPKINASNVLETALAIGLVGAAGIGLFYIAQHYFSFFSYQGLTRQQVLKVRNTVDKRLPILSRVCGDNGNFCRGIYLGPNGNMLYYRFDDDGKNASYNLYMVPSELWTTQKSLIPGLGGTNVKI